MDSFIGSLFKHDQHVMPLVDSENLHVKFWKINFTTGKYLNGVFKNEKQKEMMINNNPLSIVLISREMLMNS